MMHIKTWQREIEAAFQAGDTERYLKLVGQNKRVDAKAVDLQIMRQKLTRKVGPFGWGLVR